MVHVTDSEGAIFNFFKLYQIPWESAFTYNKLC